MSDPEEETAASQDPDTPKLQDVTTCRCGYTVGHKRVKLHGEYNWFGVACYTFGITAVPIGIKYVCRICGEVVGRSSEAAEIKRFQGR